MYATHLCEYLRALSDKDINELKAASDSAIHTMGVTFRVCHQEGGSIDRTWPFDIVPRLIDTKEWSGIEKGLKQRIKALNMFIDDLYNDQNIIKDGVFPASMLKKIKIFPSKVPSGVSYMLENRQVMKRVFPEMFNKYNILPVDDYPSQLYDMLAEMSPRKIDEPERPVM
ncbi:MAG: putative circularly permuted ATP-grasp superfamily protein [Alphaproteobacteria bacterium]